VPFYRTPIIRSPEQGTRPDTPDIPIRWTLYAAGFVLIESSAWLPEVEGIEKIRGDLAAMLGSTAAYPPARALASRGLEDSDLSWPAFADELERRLRRHLTDQAKSGYRLLRCLKNQGASMEMGGYGGIGHYYWALAIDDGKVYWVSDGHYEVFWSPIEEFDIPAGCTLPADLPE